MCKGSLFSGEGVHSVGHHCVIVSLVTGHVPLPQNTYAEGHCCPSHIYLLSPWWPYYTQATCTSNKITTLLAPSTTEPPNPSSYKLCK